MVKTQPLLRQIACRKPAVVRFHAPSAEGETETSAGSIDREFVERPEQVVDRLVRQTVAFIQNLEEHALGAGADPQRDAGRRPGELEGILQQVSHNPREDLSIRVNHHAILDGQHCECDAFDICFDGCGRHEFVDESCYEEWRPILDVLGETDFGERPTQETAYAHKAALEHSGGAPAGARIPSLDHFERDDCGVGQILHLVRQEPEAFVPTRRLAVEGGLSAPEPELGDGARDSVVEAAVQRSKVVRAYWGVQFHSQAGYGLTDVSIVLDDL